MHLIVHPVAALELQAALQWSRATFGDRTAFRLRQRFEQAGQMVIREPGLGAAESGTIRKLPLRMFPYTLVYRVDGEVITVLALAHQSRKPGYWMGR